MMCWRTGAALFVTSAAMFVVSPGATAQAPEVPMIDLLVDGEERCGLSGDGGPARDAQLDGPNDLALDGAGGLYIADTSNHAVRRVDTTTGIITTVAGVLGVSGSTGDGGPATSALLSRPEGVIVAPNGDLYISDKHPGTIRRVDNSTGLITTVAGTTPGRSGDGGPATAAQLYGPQGMAFDADGNLYIADRRNAAVRKIDKDTGIITTVVGTLGSAGGTGDGGPATSALRYELHSLTFDDAGNLYISDLRNYAIRKVDAATGIISTFAGQIGVFADAAPSGPAVDVPLGIPTQSVISGDTFYFADNHLAQILAIDLTTGVVSTLAGTALSRDITGNGGPAADALMDTPRGLVIDATGTMYVAEFDPCSVRKISLGGDSGPTTTQGPTTPNPTTVNPTTPNPTSVDSEASLPDTGSASMPLGFVAVVLVSTGLFVHRLRGAAVRRSDR